RLRPGDSLMPLYRHSFRGYEMVYQPLNGHLYPTHRLAEEWNLRHGVSAGTPATARHAGETSRAAFARPGSVVAAARLPNTDRPVSPRCPGLVQAFRGTRRPRNHKVAAVRPVAGTHDVYCLTVPEAGNFALEAGVFVRNCGIIVNVTPLEPEWRGKVTIEISNTTPLPAKIYAGEGIAQIIFLRAEAPCRISYGDKKGKYQDQT